MRVLVIVAILAASAVARADELDRAKELEASLEYEQALAIVEGLLARGGAEPGRLVELELFAGRLAGGLDRAKLAEAHFARALAVKPDAALPDGSSPKITGPFAAARAQARPLRIGMRTTSAYLVLAVTDPGGLVRALEVTIVGPGGAARTERPSVGAARVTLGAGEAATDVVALDERGNRVWVGTAPPRPVDQPPPIVRSPTRSFLARPSTWLVVTGVALAAGGISAWRFESAQSDFDRFRDEGGHDFTELQALERTGKRWAIAADVGFGVALAAGLTTTILYLRRPPARRDRVGWLFTGTGVAGRF